MRTSPPERQRETRDRRAKRAQAAPDTAHAAQVAGDGETPVCGARRTRRQMIDSLGAVRGYASVFNEFSVPLDGDEPLRERIRPGAFMLLHHPVTANVAHCSAPVATTWNKSLKVWQDGYGLAFELDVEATPEGRGTRALVASGNYSAMSFGLIEVKANYFRDEDGVLCRESRNATLITSASSLQIPPPTGPLAAGYQTCRRILCRER
jgi:HK97 family phage prohead protease